MLPSHRTPTLFPYTTLFRSADGIVDRIATGHTRNDQAETVLYRILRGASLSGLAGILPVTKEGLVRPLLETNRAEIECRSEEHTSELQSLRHLVCRLLLEKK